MRRQQPTILSGSGQHYHIEGCGWVAFAKAGHNSSQLPLLTVDLSNKWLVNSVLASQKIDTT
ncbi:MAG: hypothetical protein KDA66_20595 [Planctomycetaceae bacterium]|nr:hypothetical protein [Planctomycetaceae bacterium]